MLLQSLTRTIFIGGEQSGCFRWLSALTVCVVFISRGTNLDEYPSSSIRFWLVYPFRLASTSPVQGTLHCSIPFRRIGGEFNAPRLVGPSSNKLLPLQPCAYIAADYVLLGQLGRHLRADEYLVIPARKITIVFIMSDVTTFLIQVCSLLVFISITVDPLLPGRWRLSFRICK